MAENISCTIIDVANKYVAEVKKHYNVDSAFLFGSFVKGNTHDGSDIDIAIISNDVKGVYGERFNFMKLRRDIDLRIEPHPISINDYKKNASFIVHEIKQHGVKLQA